MPNKRINKVKWQSAKVISPLLQHPVAVIVAKDISYIANANRFQNLSIYLPNTEETSKLIGTPVESLPKQGSQTGLPEYLVHIHGGAWRDPQLTSNSVEASVAHAFDVTEQPAPLVAIAAINYTLSQINYDLPDFIANSITLYSSIKDNHTDLSREAVHPQHISDVLHGLNLLHSIGLSDKSYIFSGHSCGASIAFQAILQSPAYFGLGYLPDAPVPAAMLGLNGLFDLLNLVDGLDASHQHLRDDYEKLLSSAFGEGKKNWEAVSPSRFNPATIGERVLNGKAPQLIVLDHSSDDQLVPMNQQDTFKKTLTKVSGLQVVEGHRLTGKHATVWEQGLMFWQSIQDIFLLLKVKQKHYDKLQAQKILHH